MVARCCGNWPHLCSGAAVTPQGCLRGALGHLPWPQVREGDLVPASHSCWSQGGASTASQHWFCVSAGDSITDCFSPKNA